MSRHFPVKHQTSKTIEKNKKNYAFPVGKDQSHYISISRITLPNANHRGLIDKLMYII